MAYRHEGHCTEFGTAMVPKQKSASLKRKLVEVTLRPTWIEPEDEQKRAVIFPGETYASCEPYPHHSCAGYREIHTDLIT